MSLNQLIRSSTIFMIAITLNACSIQEEYIQPHLEIDLIDQEIIEKQNIVKNLEIYIQSQNDLPNQYNDAQLMNVNDSAVMKRQVLINIENAKKSLKIFQIQIDQLKLKQELLKQSIPPGLPPDSNLV